MRRLGPITAAAVLAIIAMAWQAPAGRAEGPLYVPEQPPPAKESVDFTNDLNHRVRHLPAPLNPPAAETPAQVESRVRVLERGVVVAAPAGRGEESKPETRSRQAAAEAGDQRSTHSSDPSSAPASAPVTSDAPAPLSVAFIGAGVLAALGLLLAARGRFPARAQRA
jgi:hypothetical protein